MIRLAILLFAIGGIVAAIGMIPLSLFANGLIPQNANPKPQMSGTISHGQISGLPGMPVLNVKASPYRILRGQSRIEGASAQGAVAATLSLSRASDISLRVPAQSFINYGRGDIHVTLSDFMFDTPCVDGETSGQFRSDAVRLTLSSYGVSAPDISGPIRCEDGQYILTAQGANAEMSLALDFQLSYDGGYTANVRVTPQRADMGQMLQILGFVQAGNNFVYTESGLWR